MRFPYIDIEYCIADVIARSQVPVSFPLKTKVLPSWKEKSGQLRSPRQETTICAFIMFEKTYCCYFQFFSIIIEMKMSLTF